MNLQTVLILVATLTMAGCETSKPLHIAPRSSRQAYVRDNPELEPRIKRAVRGGRVVPGMTKEDVREAWGEPHLRGIRRWEYKGWRNIYVMFEDDRVVSVNFYSNL